MRKFLKYPSRNGIVIPAARQYRPFTVRGEGLNDPEHYESSGLGMLRSFDAIQTTRALTKGFRALRRDVLVVPYDFSRGPCNAVSRSEWGLFPNKVYYSPNLYYPGPDCECIDTGDAGNSTLGTWWSGADNIVFETSFGGKCDGPLGEASCINLPFSRSSAAHS